MRHPLATVLILSAGVALGGLLTPKAVPAADGDPLERRVAELERVVVRDPMRPETAVVDRLAKVEKTLSLTGQPSDLKTPDDLKQAVVRLGVQQDDLDRRLKMLETERRPAVSSDTERDLRELRGSVQDNAKDLKDLDQRLHRVENKF